MPEAENATVAAVLVRCSLGGEITVCKVCLGIRTQHSFNKPRLLQDEVRLLLKLNNQLHLSILNSCTSPDLSVPTSAPNATSPELDETHTEADLTPQPTLVSRKRRSLSPDGAAAASSPAGKLVRVTCCRKGMRFWALK